MTIDRTEWYELIGEKIVDDIVDFYEHFFDVAGVDEVGRSYRASECPFCGHKDCFTITDNLVHCFSGSCGWKGTNISTWYEYAQSVLQITTAEATQRISDYYKVPMPFSSQEDAEKYEKQQRLQRMLKKAEEFYHDRLLNHDMTYNVGDSFYTPMNYLLNVRKRKESTIREFKIGFTGGFATLQHELELEGFTKEEIKNAKIWAPEGLLIYFYRHPSTKDIVRFNTKNPFQIKQKRKDELGNVDSEKLIKGFSMGGKFFYFAPGFTFKKPFIVVEGENDLQSIYETGFTQVCANGGTLEEAFQVKILNKAESTVYLMYDNDGAGEQYTELVNNELADRDVRKITYPLDYNDPDEYYLKCRNSKAVEELMADAEKLKTDNFKIRRDGNTWTIANRERKLEFKLKGKNDKGQMVGDLSYYTKGILNEKDIGISLMKAKAKTKPLNFHLHERIEKHFNENIESKSFDELLDIYNYSLRKGDIIKLIAQKVYETESTEREAVINDIKIKFGGLESSSNIVDAILKEVNDIENKNNQISFTDIPKIKICQYFNIKNNDAYVYFSYVKIDGDVKRKLPFLLRNDGTMIRLDLLRRKDSQCLLLVDNKYELPFEVTDAILELRECSLTQEWAEKFRDGKINKEELNPSRLVRQIESYIKRFYYTNDDNVYKVLALYIYMTYFYELFGQIPYLFLNGEKGSGKSILDTTIYLLASNAKMAIDISESSLFRMVSVEGGTIILDEMENLTSRKATQDSTMAAALKGGYARSGSIYRFNKEKNSIDGFNVYGPKVISNIFGIDDVIEDRCIAINTYRLKVTKETKMEDPKYYMQEKLDEIRELTSKCALSSLLYFQELHSIYTDSLFETGNARLSQILTPVMAIAKLADKEERELSLQVNPDMTSFEGEYERGLTSFYNNVLAGSKDGVDQDTPEGIIKRCIPIIAKEIYGLVPDSEKDYTVPSNHKYQEPIKYSLEEGWFEVNVMHFKCFIEEAMPGDTAYTRIIPKWVKTVFKHNPGEIKRKTTTIVNEDLVKECRGNSKPKVNHYRFYFSDYIDTTSEFFNTVETENKDTEEQIF